MGFNSNSKMVELSVCFIILFGLFLVELLIYGVNRIFHFVGARYNLYCCLFQLVVAGSYFSINQDGKGFDLSWCTFLIYYISH